MRGWVCVASVARPGFLVLVVLRRISFSVLVCQGQCLFIGCVARGKFRVSHFKLQVFLDCFFFFLVGVARGKFCVFCVSSLLFFSCVARLKFCVASVSCLGVGGERKVCVDNVSSAVFFFFFFFFSCVVGMHILCC